MEFNNRTILSLRIRLQCRLDDDFRNMGSRWHFRDGEYDVADVFRLKNAGSMFGTDGIRSLIQERRFDFTRVNVGDSYSVRSFFQTDRGAQACGREL